MMRDADPPLAVWLDGRLHEATEPLFPPAERGLLYGDGLFETLPVQDGLPLDSARHLDRLSWSARELGFPGLAPALWERGIAEGLAAAARQAEPAAVLRVTWLRGQARGRGYAPRARDGPPSLLVVVHGADPSHGERVREGVRARTVRGLAPGDLARFKTTSSLVYVVAAQRARAMGDREAILVDDRGRVLEAAGSNVFAVRGGRAATPPASLPILSGIGRARVRAWLGADRCFEEPIVAEDLMRADEAFLTNAVQGVVPLVAVDGRSLGVGRPGPVTRELIEKHQAWRAAARKARYHAP